MQEFDDYKKYIFVGGGTMAERLYPQTETENRKLVKVVDFFDDEKRAVSEFHGIKIKHVDECVDDLINPNCAIVVAINGFQAKKVIEEQLIGYIDALNRVYIANPYTTLRPCVINKDFSSEQRIEVHDKRYDEVYNLLKKNDVKSSRIFNLLRNSKTYDNIFDTFEIVSYSSIKEDYEFEEDYFTSCYFNSKKHKKDATIFDCGAYIGDSIEKICDSIPESNIFYYAFEPVKNNAEQIKNNSLFGKLCKELYVYEFGIGENNEKLKFDCGGDGENQDNGRFCLNENTNFVTELEIKSIDSLDISINGQLYIKMDIEGAELGALKGARNTIQKYRPCMAICVYHRKNDLIDIPLFINSIVENYNYYLRGGFHTILWAIPKELDS